MNESFGIWVPKANRILVAFIHLESEFLRFSCTNTFGDANLVLHSTIKSISNILLISWVSNYRAQRLVWYDAEWISCLSDEVYSIWRFVAFRWPRCPSHTCWTLDKTGRTGPDWQFFVGISNLLRQSFSHVLFHSANRVCLLIWFSNFHGGLQCTMLKALLISPICKDLTFPTLAGDINWFESTCSRWLCAISLKRASPIVSRW